MLSKLPVTVTLNERDTWPQYPVFCYALLPSGLIQSCLFSFFPAGIILQSQGWHSLRAMHALHIVLRHLHPSGGFSHSLQQSHHVHHIPVLTQLRPIHCKQTICPLFIQIISNMRCLPTQPDKQGVNKCTRRGAELQLGIKMPTLHYGWSRSLLLAAWVWG